MNFKNCFKLLLFLAISGKGKLRDFFHFTFHVENISVVKSNALRDQNTRLFRWLNYNTALSREYFICRTYFYNLLDSIQSSPLELGTPLLQDLPNGNFSASSTHEGDEPYSAKMNDTGWRPSESTWDQIQGFPPWNAVWMLLFVQTN